MRTAIAAQLLAGTLAALSGAALVIALVLAMSLNQPAGASSTRTAPAQVDECDATNGGCSVGTDLYLRVLPNSGAVDPGSGGVDSTGGPPAASPVAGTLAETGPGQTAVIAGIGFLLIGTGVGLIRRTSTGREHQVA